MDDRSRRPARVRDRGFTLIESLVVVMVIGIIAAAAATTVTVVMRNTPPSEMRADDARSLQGLVTWLPQDVDAAPPEGFVRDPAHWPCSGPAPADSHNVLTTFWSERGASTTHYFVSYRYEQDDETWSIRRYTCDSSSGWPAGPAQRINLTGDLPEWNPSSPPAWVTMCRSTVTSGGTCPTADIVPDTISHPTESNGGGVKSLQLSITRPDGGVVTIDAAPKNPDQDLADDPNASLNQTPKIAVETVTVQMHAGETATFDLATTHGAHDPDGDPISAALDSTEPIPPGLTVSTSDPLNVEITTDPTLGPGVISPGIILIVSDNRAGWVDAVLRVEILPTLNLPPTATAPNYHLQIVSGDDVVLALDATHGVSDPNGDPLTATVVSYPATFTNPPTPNAPDPLDLEVKTPSGRPLGPVADPIVIEVSDGINAPVVLTISIEFVAAPNSPPTATTSNINIDMYADESVTLSLDTTHGVTDPDGDALSITEIDGQPSEVTVTLDGGLGITIETDPGLPIGTLSPAVDVDVRDPLGERLDLTITVTIIPTPPPPSNCELLGLTASPSTVDRHANGSQPHLLDEDVTVTLTYSGSCDGLHLHYDTGDTSGLGVGPGRIFPAGSPTSVVIVSKDNGGTEKWAPATHTLTASTTSTDAIVSSVTTTLTVT